jgi:uncharacterized membrane protein YbaN (DUF454 family)
MNWNRLISRVLGWLAMALSIAGIVAATLQWSVGVCYAIFVLMLTVALAATRAERAHRRRR